MRRFQFAPLALLALVVLLAAQPLVAATYYVGACKGGAFFTTINDAVTAATAGSTIDICPGTYPEQVVINKALTLQGIVSNDSSQAVIALPSAGLGTTSTINTVFSTVAAQVEVTTGPVNITNITVDGTAGTSNCPSANYVGIYYGSGSSGTMNGVDTSNQNCTSSSGGIGILAENGASATLQSVKIENSNIHDSSYIGIFTCSNQTPSTLTATITGNSVASVFASGYYGIWASCNAGGSISGNTVVSNYLGVYAGSPSTTVSGNTVIGGTYGILTYGIFVGAKTSVTSNHVLNSIFGIWLAASNATIKTNAITLAFDNNYYGIVFNCLPGTVTGNTINGYTYGIAGVPAAFSGVNKFYNVATDRSGGC